MIAWLVGVAAATIALAAVVGAIVLDRPATPRATEPSVPVLPTGRLLRDRRFRLRWRGYDPHEVDAVLGAAADALDALAAEAGAEAWDRAQQRLRAARGQTTDAPPARRRSGGGTETSTAPVERRRPSTDTTDEPPRPM